MDPFLALGKNNNDRGMAMEDSNMSGDFEMFFWMKGRSIIFFNFYLDHFLFSMRRTANMDIIKSEKRLSKIMNDAIIKIISKELISFYKVNNFKLMQSCRNFTKT